jgi:hypothetical protein
MNRESKEEDETRNSPQWNDALENVVKKEGEQSQALYLLHHMSHIWTSKCNDYIQIPSIVLASVTGFLSATSSVLPPIAIGAMSLSVGVLNTIISYYKFAQKAESHRITSLMYMKAYKSIESELALPVYQRVNAAKLLNDLRDTMSKISDIAPPIPTSIIDQYKRSNKDHSVSQPIITNGLEPIVVFRHEEDDKIKINIVPEQRQKIDFDKYGNKVIRKASVQNKPFAYRNEPNSGS